MPSLMQQTRNSSLLQIARQHGIAPCMLARMVLGAKLGIAPPLVSRLLKQIAVLEDARLRREVEECMLADQVYSPFIERLKDHVGTEWEFHLTKRLAGLQFKTEDELRAEVRSMLFLVLFVLFCFVCFFFFLNSLFRDLQRLQMCFFRFRMLSLWQMERKWSLFGSIARVNRIESSILFFSTDLHS